MHSTYRRIFGVHCHETISGVDVQRAVWLLELYAPKIFDMTVAAVLVLVLEEVLVWWC
jgi:hypothetical protein